MPDEPATLDAPVEEPEVVTPEEPASPEGDAPSEGGGERLEVIRDLFKGATVAELRAALDDVPTDVRSELEAEIERRGEQRAATRKRETQEATESRLGLWKPYAERYQRAQSYLQAAVSRAKAGDIDAISNVDAITAAMDDYHNGGIAKVVLENEAYVGPLVDRLLPDLTPEEQKKLDKPLYEFGRTGLASHVMPVLAELAMERARKEGFDEGLKKGQQDREAKVALAEKLAKIEEIRKQAPGVPVTGQAVSKTDERTRLQKEIAAFDPMKLPPQERAAKLKELQQRARSA